MKGKQLLPATYLLIAIIVMLILHFVFPVVQLIPKPWNLLGLLPLGLGVWINLVADRAFHRTQTTVKPFEEPTALITDGAFAISRNPMYLGFVAILLGISVLLRTLTPYAIVILFAILMDRLFIQVEERNMERIFGPAWSAYRKKVRRWI
jgi:protein-S-isoprenylcysteine O-methyltransferase Ste14